jgi:hypothetical protein
VGGGYPATTPTNAIDRVRNRRICHRTSVTTVRVTLALSGWLVTTRERSGHRPVVDTARVVLA